MPALPTLPHCILHTAHCQEHTGKNCKQPTDQCCSTLVTGASGHTASTAHWNQQSGRNRTLASGLCANLASTTPVHWQNAHCSSTAAQQKHIGRSEAQWPESADAALAPALSAHKYKSFTKVEFLLSTKMREFEGIFSIAYIPPI